MPTNKDPGNTTERLTDALCIIATSEKSAKERYLDAVLVLSPLIARDFPLQEDAEMLRSIVREYDVNNISQSEIKEALEKIWKLYWRMSNNVMYE